MRDVYGKKLRGVNRVPECLFKKDAELIGTKEFCALPGTRFVAGLCLLCNGACSREIDADSIIVGVTERPVECKSVTSQESS